MLHVLPCFYKNTCYIFIFDRCHHSQAVETPAKYEDDLKIQTYNFVISEMFVSEKITNGALVTPTPGGDIQSWRDERDIYLVLLELDWYHKTEAYIRGLAVSS